MHFQNKKFHRFLWVGGLNTLFSYLIYLVILQTQGYLIAFYISFVFSVLFTSVLNVGRVFGTRLSFVALFFYVPYYVLYGLLGGEVVKFFVDRIHVDHYMAPIFSLILLTPAHYICSKALISTLSPKNEFDRDLDQLVKLQIDSLPSSYISMLGEGFTRSYWKMCFKSKNYCVVTKKISGQIVSLCSVCLEPSNFINDLLFKTPLVFYVVANIHKKFVWKFLLSFIRMNPSPENIFPDCPELVLLATDRNYRGKGLGRSIIADTERILEKLGHSCFFIKTEHDNYRAQKFYSDLGFLHYSDQIYCVKPNIVLIKEIAKA